MEKYVGVKFKSNGKIYDFLCGPFVLKVNDQVIVSTEQGLGFGTVVNPPVPVSERESKSPLKKVFRLANQSDLEQRERNKEVEIEAKEFCQECIDELGLQMNLFSVESTFDSNKLTFFFTAEGRVDFRQLIKMLVKRFRIRIEMRQVGIRNQAKMTGGMGRCGREICCSSFLDKFDPVSIRMAKEQDLSLNPTKISGLCGRLMCCLTYENETYKHLRCKFPKIGSEVKTEKGKGKVVNQNVIRRVVRVSFDDGTFSEYKLDELL